jgi:ABC-type proline/glycine betaine transport system substrate-binding protein
MMRRRSFVTCAGAGALTLGLRGIGLAAPTPAGLAGANDDVRLAVVGIGSAEAKGGLGGRGHQLI